MKCRLVFVLFAVLATLLPLKAQSPDDQYVQIYTLIQQADALNEAGQTSQALEKYLEAQTSLKRLQKVFSTWNPKVVNFRLNYLEGKIGALTARVPAPASPGQTATPAPSTPTLTEADRKVAALENEVRRLQTDNTVLQSKLKEALATQPAAIDARELTSAQEKIQSLTKENELLRITVAGQQGGTSSVPAGTTLEDTRQALADAHRKLSEETQRANDLALAKEAVQKQLDEVSASGRNTADLEKARKEIETANAKLTEQIETANKLAVEKETLQARLTALSERAEVADTLRAENEILKRQLSELKATGAGGESSKQVEQLAQVQARLAALQSEADILRLEKTALQDRISEALAARDGEAQRIQQLERERDDLKKQMAKTEKGGWFHRRSKADAAKMKELSEQIDSYRSRLEVLEAKSVPYTTEELALLKPAQMRPAADEAGAQGKPAKEPPRGTTALAAEAQRLFASRQFDKAEQKYLEMLRQDESNVYTLANLAAIQLELGHLEEAEKHVKQALASSPNDAYSLSILGYLKLRQEKYDESLAALSRAARLEPANAEIQNYLGIVLSHKGLRAAAETALRKAIQLEPDYASAHNNLAVIYATEKPPWMGLARWHYQKALSAGHARNADLEKLLEAAPTNAAPVAP